MININNATKIHQYSEKSLIVRNLIIKDNLIHIDYIEYDYFLSCLANLAHFRNMIMDELFHEWGFKRINREKYTAILHK